MILLKKQYDNLKRGGKMRKLLVLVVSLLLSVNAFAADDATNKASFEKECAAMIAPGGACGDVVAGGGGRRGCVSKPENFEKATPACKAVIEEWRAMQKK
jgi:hypothetical protein